MALIDDAVTLQLLQDIHTEMLKRVTRQPPQRQQRARFELLLHLQRLSATLMADEFGCDGGEHPCPDGTCPPCFGRELRYYQELLEKLRQRNATT